MNPKSKIKLNITDNQVDITIIYLIIKSGNTRGIKRKIMRILLKIGKAALLFNNKYRS